MSMFSVSANSYDPRDSMDSSVGWFGSENFERFIEEIPKSDLHVHLDGSVRISTLIDLAKEKNIELPSYDEEELRRTVYKDGFDHLEEYLECFKYTTMVMQSSDALERIAYEFAVDNYSEGVRYFEVRFAPQLHASVNPKDKMMIEDVFKAVNIGLKRATDEFNFKLTDRTQPRYHYGIIASALRIFTPEMSRYYQSFCAIHEHLSSERICGLASEALAHCAVKCRDELAIPIVAFDIAGPENGFKASIHKAAYDYVHSRFMSKTVHAGEGFGPESIFQAVNDCHADRIGHGFHLFSEDKVIGERSSKDPAAFVTNLTKYICDRRICLEVCPTSNLHTMPGLQLADHAIKHMLEANVSFCINTDNRTVSQTSTVKELCSVVRAFNISPKKLRYIVINGFKRSFYTGSYTEKCNYVRRVLALYDKIAAKYGFNILDEHHGNTGDQGTLQDEQRNGNKEH